MRSAHLAALLYGAFPDNIRNSETTRRFMKAGHDASSLDRIWPDAFWWVSE
jgi:hypothetical protein